MRKTPDGGMDIAYWDTDHVEYSKEEIVSDWDALVKQKRNKKRKIKLKFFTRRPMSYV